MVETGPHPNGELRNPDVSYERRDVKPITLVKWVIALAVGGILVHVLIWYQFQHFLRNAEETYESPVSPLSKTEQEGTGEGPITGSRLPPEPRLEGLAPEPPTPGVHRPEHTVGRHRPGIGPEIRAEEAQLDRYEWAGKDKDRVRIPIERAMRLALENEALRQKYLPRAERPREPKPGEKQGGREGKPSDAGRKPEGAKP